VHEKIAVDARQYLEDFGEQAKVSINIASKRFKEEDKNAYEKL